MKLYLCEKPSQAKDIGKVLDVLDGKFDGYYKKSDVAVTWAFGHILANAMPDAYGEAYADFGNISALPLIPTEWKMLVPPKVAKQFKVVKGLLAQAEEVVIATDADREGEVIAREILDYCAYRKKISRFWTSGLDPVSVKKALASIMPGSKKEALYQAGLARSRADWLVGMNLSRSYTVAYAAGFGKEHTLSIGRIQTPTLNLVVRRDAAIDNFVSYPYYTLSADFQTTSKELFTAAWLVPEALQNSDGLCIDKSFVSALAAKLPGSPAQVVTAKRELKKTSAPLPYSLSALQKEAGKRLGLSASKVLAIAQDLYEKHKITSYPRTPCRYLPKSQQADVPAVMDALIRIDGSLTTVIAQANPGRDSRVWNDGQVNKHSHHAIIPTLKADVDLAVLTKQEREIYTMIRNRYIAQFYPDYEYDAAVIVVSCCEQLFKATGQTPKVQGWKVFLGNVEEEKSADEATDSRLPIVALHDNVDAVDAQASTKKTAPLPRFTEATLLDEMQTLSDFLKTVEDEQIKKILRSTEGLGTEATRANIIDRLFEMGYIIKERGKVLSTEKGRNLIARIPAMVADPVTTAKWELALAGIEAGRLKLDDFMDYQADLIRQLVEQAKTDAAARADKLTRAGGASRKRPLTSNHAGQTCPTCSEGTLQERHLKDKPEKRYLGCTAYPNCKHFEWLQ